MVDLGLTEGGYEDLEDWESRTRTGMYFPYPNEIMAILSQMPDWTKPPASFVSFFRTIIRVYNSNSRDLWPWCNVITPVEHARFLANLGGHDTRTNLLAQRPARKDAIIIALTLQKPIDISWIVLDTGPQKGEGAEEFLKKFSEIYIVQSGDTNYRNERIYPSIMLFW